MTLREQPIFLTKILCTLKDTQHEKTTRYIDDIISIPKELQIKCDPITLNMDSLVINGMVSLTLVGKPIYFKDAVLVKNNSARDFYEALDITLCQDNTAG